MAIKSVPALNASSLGLDAYLTNIDSVNILLSNWLIPIDLMSLVGFVQHVPKINGEIPSIDVATLDHQRLLERYFSLFHNILFCNP